jgi:1-aminocyclopropane-1-carboxylate deaminase
MLLNPSIKIEVQKLGTIGDNIKVKVARLDKIHPVISGNKLFKLYYFLEEYKTSGKTTIASFGGAYSNHLVATAYAAQQLLVSSVGFVRGECIMNQSLSDCIAYGMKLVFLDRNKYSQFTKDPSNLQNKYPEYYFIPEGGYAPIGAQGAARIMESLSLETYTHICTSVGTATTLAGLLRNYKVDVIAVPALKGMHDLEERINYLNNNDSQNLTIWDNYHFGGYGKTTDALFDFMNELYARYQLPTDIVYTSKMLYAVIDKIKEGYFPLGSEVMCLHTGGLQGNRSLAKGILDF